MKKNKYIRPTLVGASVLFLSACSYSSFSTPSVLVNTQQSQSAGNSELKRIADELALNGNHEAAIPIYRHLGARNGDPEALSALAASLIAQGAMDEATGILNLLVERGQTTGPVWYSIGKTKLAQGRFEEALTAFNNAAGSMNGDTRVRSGAAISLAALGRTDEAIAAFQTSSDTLSLSNKALVLVATGHADAAVRILEPIVQSSQGSSRDRQNLAMAYLLNGQEGQARRIARLDLDTVTTNNTFTFYRSLASLQPAQRMQALVTGTVNPDWTRAELANLELQETEGRQDAAQRLITASQLAEKVEPAPKPILVAKAPEAKPEPIAKPVFRADYVLTEIPPLLEPEGWALQIGAYRSIKNLMRGWTILYRQSGDLLENVPPRRSEVDFGNTNKTPKGFYFRLNAGPLKSYALAKELCSALKARGTRCWIRPPEQTEGKLSKSKRADTDETTSILTASAEPQ